MNKERSALISWIRGEIVGPSRPLGNPVLVSFENNVLVEHEGPVNGPMVWEPNQVAGSQEVLSMNGDAPHKKYGAGLLHPDGLVLPDQDNDEDNINPDDDPFSDEGHNVPERNENKPVESLGSEQFDADDFEVSSSDARYPSTMGITFNIRIDPQGEVVIHLPREKRFFWQTDNDEPFAVNGRYEQCIRRTQDGREHPSLWRRYPCFSPGMATTVSAAELQHRKPIFKGIELPEGSPDNMALLLKFYPRRITGQDGFWLLTVVLQNASVDGTRQEHQASTLYQSFFEVTLSDGEFMPYPESSRNFQDLDEDEQSLALLYRDSSTWAIGHGCAAGWDAELDETPVSVYADTMPAVELPSMTPDIVDSDGAPIRLSMRQMSSFTPTFDEEAVIGQLADEYAGWIQRQRFALAQLEDNNLQMVADRHLAQAGACLKRIRNGIAILKSNENARKAFRLANLAMLLQQIAGKQLNPRSLVYDQRDRRVVPDGAMESPWQIYRENREGARIGHWRAFQLAFFLMSIEGVIDGTSSDRDTVDLIWFPTGGGKTEAYLAVVSFYLFYHRLQMGEAGNGGLRPDGTNVLMRYTLRMLTSQQFQRAASLIAAMEFLRRFQGRENLPAIPGNRFSIGLWVGSEATPNKINDAGTRLNDFRHQRNGVTGNPFVLSECPWCRAEIGRYNGPPSQLGNEHRVKGIEKFRDAGPLLKCSDSACAFGGFNMDTWLPVEVVDERIYRTRPSLVIGTVDKFAMIAWKPEAGALFGKTRENGNVTQTHTPPGLIIQDELHLISGPLGTMYAMYEIVFGKLCTAETDGNIVKPKIISSTATIRGASDQVKAVYARDRLNLFPCPGLTMGDSFFGAYARDEKGKLKSGRLYLGIHANEFAILTAETRVFASALFSSFFLDSDNRDPWWTLLVFFNSIRELGGARSLFDSDIRDRMKFLFNRVGQEHGQQARRYICNLEELTGRIDNAAIVAMMDKLNKPYHNGGGDVVDACLASNVIEVGVDIDRLSLMGVVGQPKTTAQYIQVTGRVGRKWETQPGLVLMLYNPSKSRDRSHYEHFYSYHKRLYEQVEPTSATPFSGSAITRALPGMLISWVRQHVIAENPGNFDQFRASLDEAYTFVAERCRFLLAGSHEECDRALDKLASVRDELVGKWRANPQLWQKAYQQDPDGEYLMLWPGEYRTGLQERKGVDVASSMRSVDATAGLKISDAYFNASTNLAE